MSKSKQIKEQTFDKNKVAEECVHYKYCKKAKEKTNDTTCYDGGYLLNHDKQCALYDLAGRSIRTKAAHGRRHTAPDKEATVASMKTTIKNTRLSNTKVAIINHYISRNIIDTNEILKEMKKYHSTKKEKNLKLTIKRLFKQNSIPLPKGF